MSYSTNLELYDKVVELHPNIERKGKTMPYTSVNGHMFSIMDKEGNLGLRLSKSDREDFIQKFNSKLMIQYGAAMKEYVVIPQNILMNTTELFKFLQMSFNSVSALKPKSTKRKK